MSLTDLEPVVALLRRIAPLPDGVLVVGSWGLALLQYRLEARAQDPRTLDLDLAAYLGGRSDRSIDPWMTRAAEALGGLYTLEARGAVHGGTPCTVLAPRSSDLPRIEFLAQRPGGRRHRSASGPIRPMEPGNLQLLFVAPWRVVLDEDLEVWTANPLSFVLQKALIRRPGAKGDKDAAGVLRLAQIAVRTEAGLQGLAGLVAEPRAWRRKLRQAREFLRADYLESPHPRARAGLAAQAAGASVGEARLRDAISTLRRFLELCGEEI